MAFDSQEFDISIRPNTVMRFRGRIGFFYSLVRHHEAGRSISTESTEIKMAKERSGGCQCGRIRFQAKALSDNPHICHCRMCQKASGNFFGARVSVLLTDLTWTRGEPSRFYSSKGAARGFCSSCGTPLFYHGEGSMRISMSIGAFDQPNDIELAFELGIEGKVPQLAQLGSLENFGTTEEDDPEGSQQARETSNQHPDYDTVNWVPL
jgi:hypothetical protein